MNLFIVFMYYCTPYTDQLGFCKARYMVQFSLSEVFVIDIDFKTLITNFGTSSSPLNYADPRYLKRVIKKSWWNQRKCSSVSSTRMSCNPFETEQKIHPSVHVVEPFHITLMRLSDFFWNFIVRWLPLRRNYSNLEACSVSRVINLRTVCVEMASSVPLVGCMFLRHPPSCPPVPCYAWRCLWKTYPTPLILQLTSLQSFPPQCRWVFGWVTFLMQSLKWFNMQGRVMNSWKICAWHWFTHPSVVKQDWLNW